MTLSMPPTMIVIFGWAEPSPSEAELWQAVRLAVAAMAASAVAATRRVVMDIVVPCLSLCRALCGSGFRADRDRSGQMPDAVDSAGGRQLVSRRSSLVISHSAARAMTVITTIPAKTPAVSKLFLAC